MKMSNKKNIQEVNPKEKVLSPPLPEWETIKESDVEDFSLMGDPYPLPKPARDRKDLVFRWVENSPERIKQLRRKDPPLTWWVCNSTNTPFLEDFFDEDGAVHCNDQILVVKPRWMRDIETRAKNENFEALFNTKSLKGKVRESDNKVRWKEGPESQIGSEDVVMAAA